MQGEGNRPWWWRRGAVIGTAVVVLVAGGAGVAVATDGGWFTGAPPDAAPKAAAEEPTPPRAVPESMESGAGQAPESLSPPRPPKPRTNPPKPPKPAAKCDPAPRPTPPKYGSGPVVNPRIPFNGRQVVSVCLTPLASIRPPKVLTDNQAAAVINALGDLRLATKPMPCTKEYRGHFQVVIQTSHGTHVFNGEGHGCGYVTYNGVTFTGGKGVYSLIARYVRS